MTPPVPVVHLDRPTFVRGLGRLVANYRSTFPEARGDALTAAWWDVLGALPWLTNALFEQAVHETLLCRLEYLPTVGEFVEICRGERDDAEREARARLPAPVAPGRDVTPTSGAAPRGIDRVEWDRNVEIGRARHRARMAALRATSAPEAG